jgi:hypothetical protein
MSRQKVTSNFPTDLVRYDAARRALAERLSSITRPLNHLDGNGLPTESLARGQTTSTGK